MNDNQAKDMNTKQRFAKARAEMMLDYIDNTKKTSCSEETKKSLAKRIEQIHADANQFTVIVKQAKAMGIKIIASDAIKEKTSPQDLRRLILEYTSCEEVT